MATKITYFVHATTTDNEKGILTGWNQGELSEIGRRQAREVGDLTVDKKFDLVFCSDLKRAVDSASLAFGGRFQIIPDKRLREANYGDLNGSPSSAFRQDHTHYIDEAFPNGESYRDVGKRVAEFLDFLRKNYNGKHVAIMAHRAPQLALDVLLKGKTWRGAIEEDWRIKEAWQPGWEYILEEVKK